jgi:hypothetical protein
MSLITVSPGIFTQENDQSFIPQGVAAIGGAIIGLTQKGPAFQPVKVTNFTEFRNKFGNLDPKLYVPYTAKNYLQNLSTLNVVRVLSTQTPLSLGSAIILAFGTATANTTITGSATAMAILRSRNSTTASATVSGTSNNFVLNVDGVSAANLSLNYADPSYIGKVLGTNPFSAVPGDLVPSVYVEEIFDYAYFASAGVTGSATTNAAFNSAIGGFSEGNTPTVVSQNLNGTVYDLFSFATLGDGDASNTDIKVSISVDTSQVSVSSYPTFVVSIRDYSDTDQRPVVLETFTCNLDPTSNAYIKRVIGDRIKTFNTAIEPPELVYDGEYENASQYVRVVMASPEGGWPTNAKPSGFKAIPAMGLLVSGPHFKTPWKMDHTNFTSVKDSKVYMGFDSTKNGASDRLSFYTTSISASTSGTVAKGFLIASATAELSGSGSLTSAYNFIDASSTAISTSATVYDSLIRFTVPFYGGWDGIDPRKDKLQLLLDGTLSADLWNAIKVLGNPDELDFNLLTVPGVFAGGPATQGNIPQKALEMVTNRGDAFYIMDIADGTHTSTSGAVLNSTVNGVVTTAQGFDSSYAASYFPSVRILDGDNNKFVWVPASVVVMGAYAFNDKVGQPWWAPAGLNRGVLNVFEARKRVTQAHRDTLYLGKVNPITTFAGQGVVVWGQKTLQTAASALDRVNVRRLMLYARKTIASVAKYYVFEANNSKTRSDITNAINPILETIQKQQGIEKFQVICDDTNNTPDVIDRNILIGAIYIQPTKTAEIFIFTFNLTRTGVSFAA